MRTKKVGKISKINKALFISIIYAFFLMLGSVCAADLNNVSDIENSNLIQDDNQYLIKI